VTAYAVFNAGSSSLKFQLFEPGPNGALSPFVRGKVEGLGAQPKFAARDGSGKSLGERTWPASDALDHEQGTMYVLEWARERLGGRRLAAIGHRVVHGGRDFSGPALIDDAVLAKLEAYVPLAPLHQPHNLKPIRIVRRHRPDLPQVASFDTAFHQTQPEIAQLFALPYAYAERGVRRYGFHGLSYAYVASVLGQCAPGLEKGKAIVAHLGSGASLCAMVNGRSVSSTMGFSALDGLPMGTRCGSLDPAVVFYLMREDKLDPAAVEKLLYNKSGLLGVSGLSNDMRALREAAAGGHERARLAIDLFVYRIRREMGALTAVMGGLDGIVFTAGIGENDPATRAEVLRGMEWAGLKIDEGANRAGGPLLTLAGGPQAWVVPTDEELMIARETAALLAAG
jgi:acetate kinase